MSSSASHLSRAALHGRSRRELEAAIARDPAAFRVLTGDRPTGPLHLGHYFGTLENRVRLQALGVELFVLIADYQTITDRDSPASLPRDVDGLVADYLAVGLDPERATIFAHSQVEALNQLLLPFLSLVSVAEVGRNPTVKDEIAATGGKATSRADVHLSRPPGRRHPLLPGEPRAGRQGSASASGARAHDRPSLQRPLQPGARVLPGAGAVAEHGTADPRPRRTEDEQESAERDPARSDRSRDRRADPTRDDGLGAPHHLRARTPARSLESRPAHRALPGPLPGGGRCRDRRRAVRAC